MEKNLEEPAIYGIRGALSYIILESHSHAFVANAICWFPEPYIRSEARIRKTTLEH